MTIDVESFETAIGSAQGFLVMAEGEGINESIGCEIDSKEGVLNFIKSFENNKEALSEFMPDSDFTKVSRLYII